MMLEHPLLEETDRAPSPTSLERYLQLETLAALQTFGWFLERYRRLADPTTCYLAQHIYDTLKLEARGEMTPQETEAYLYRVRNLTRALAGAVREWRSGLVP